MDSLDKLYLKLNKELDGIKENMSEEEIVANFSRISNLIDEAEFSGKLLLSTEKEKLLNPLIVKLATNELLYFEYAEFLTNICYKKYIEGIKSLTSKEIYEYLRDNMKYTSHNNMIESMWMDNFIESKINKKICPSLANDIFGHKSNEQFRVFCDSLLKKKASDYAINIKSNPITLSEYLKKMQVKKNPKTALKRTAEYFKCGGTCNDDNLVSLNLTTFKLYKLLSFGEDIDYTLLQTGYHEMAHAKITRQTRLEYPFFDRNIYKQQKTKLFLSKDYAYYLKNHDYFENEIAAEIDGYTSMAADLEIHAYKNLSNLKPKISQRILKFMLNRVTMQYDAIDTRFDELLRQNPDFVKLNKWLRYEYNKDGTRKELLDLMIEKLNYQVNLNKEIEQEKKLSDKNNENLDYLNGYRDSDEVDKLFYEMIYRKIEEYSFDEFDEIVSRYDGMALEEITNAINYTEGTITEKNNMLEENSIAANDFISNKMYVGVLSARLQKYKSILNKHIKQKRR